jgi:hypothetical protein
MNRLYVLFWAFCLGFYSGFSAPIARHFIVIGIDGMSPDGVQKARTPVMDRMMKEGAYTFYARGVLPTSSSQNWASMVMGAGPEQHGITGNGWERDDYPFPPVIVGPEGLFPTIFCQIKKADPMAETGIIYDWDGFGRLCEKSCKRINNIICLRTGGGKTYVAAMICKYWYKKHKKAKEKRLNYRRSP